MYFISIYISTVVLEYFYGSLLDPAMNSTLKTKHSVYLCVFLFCFFATDIEDLPCSLLRDFINLTLWDIVEMKASIFCPTFRKFKVAYLFIYLMVKHSCLQRSSAMIYKPQNLPPEACGP